jgi:GAF domain-containing protein
MADEQTIKNVLLNTERLKILRDLALIDSPAETVYDRITQLASKAVGSPVSLVSMVGSDYQFFKSFVGLPEPWASDRSTPLSHSFCQHVVATNEPLIVSDARNVDFLKDNLAIPDLNVIGYLGIPLTLQSGQRLGSFCVIDGKPVNGNR